LTLSRRYGVGIVAYFSLRAYQSLTDGICHQSRRFLLNLTAAWGLGGTKKSFMFWIINIVLDIFAGILAWNIVEPESFGGALVFLMLWAVFGGVCYLISIFLMGLFSGDLKK